MEPACFVLGGLPMSESADTHETITFVVRLWRESNTTGQGHWHGRVEHVASQQVAYVEDAAGVAGFIERWTASQDTTTVVEAERDL
jgi:hypothetical protein